MGVIPLVAHMFIFYFAVLSAITPPVAVASWAAAGMAQADPWKTGWAAVQLGLATFIVPFMFFYSPLLFGQGEWLAVAHVFVTASLGVLLLAAATEGCPLPRPLQGVLFLAALLLITPEAITDAVGLVAGVAVFAWQRWRHGGHPAAKVARQPAEA